MRCIALRLLLLWGRRFSLPKRCLFLCIARSARLCYNVPAVRKKHCKYIVSGSMCDRMTLDITKEDSIIEEYTEKT